MEIHGVTRSQNRFFPEFVLFVTSAAYSVILLSALSRLKNHFKSYT